MLYNNHTLNVQIILQNCFECYQRNNTQEKNFFNLIHIEAADPRLFPVLPWYKRENIKTKKNYCMNASHWHFSAY